MSLAVHYNAIMTGLSAFTFKMYSAVRGDCELTSSPTTTYDTPTRCFPYAPHTLHIRGLRRILQTPCYFTSRCLRTMIFCEKRGVNRECVARPLFDWRYLGNFTQNDFVFSHHHFDIEARLSWNSVVQLKGLVGTTDKSQIAEVRTHPGFSHIRPRYRMFPSTILNALLQLWHNLL
jgi:hypothetical protein